MDSLLASYASSDEENEDTNQHQPHSQNSPMGSIRSSASLFCPLPPPSRNSASLPPPKHSSTCLKTLNEGVTGQEAKSKPFSLFSSLPPPKPHNTAKRLVEFKPPINYALTHDEDDDDGPRRKKRASDISALASSGGLSALLPPPKNTTLGAGAGESGHVGRRSILEIPSSSPVEPPPPSVPEPNTVEIPQYDEFRVFREGDEGFDAYSNNSDNYSEGGGADPPYSVAAWSQSHGHGNWEVGVSGHYDSTISNNLQEQQNEQDQAQALVIGGRGKAERRGGSNQIPCDIIEVKQDELMSNRPREDQVKLTGIAFGPAYKPVSAVKDKPSKLHKRKHQIGSLYYELKQKEMELVERRARGQLTKAETQAKYGW